MKIGKYEFNDYEQAQKKIDDLGYEIEVIEGEEIKHINHGHCVVELGNIIISYAVVPESNGLHTFFGLEYEYYKI